MSQARRLALALAATCLVAALVGAPAATASGGSKSAAAQSAPKAKSSQSAKTLAKRISTVSKRANRNRRNITALGKSLTALGTELRNAITGGDKTIDDKINGIVGAVTPVLQRLGTGLTDLAAGVQTLAAATQKGFDDVKAGFAQVETAITDVATSQEYGIVGVFAAPGGGNTCCRLITTGSADIPDDGNAVSAGGTLPLRVANPTDPADPTTQPPGTLPPDSEVFIHAAIRSGEADGTGTGDPAGQVGGLMTLKCVSIGGCGELNLGGGAFTVESGDLICSVGPTPNSPFETPNGEVQLGLVNVPEASDRTDQTQPSATTSETTVNPLAAAAESDAGAAATANPGSNAGDKRCTLPNVGTYELDVQTQFVDIPTSATPGPKD